MRTTRTRRGTLLCLTLAASLGASTLMPLAAHADSFDEARSAYRLAEKHYGEGSFLKAADKYEVAYRISRSPVLLFNIAQSFRRQFQKDGDYENLAKAARLYKEFIDKANPKPNERELAEENLAEVQTLSVDEAKRRFATADAAYKRTKYLDALREYDIAYQLSGHTPILFNMAQAERQQFEVDLKLERLARAEDLIRTYRREGGSRVDPKVIEELLATLATQRQEYQRKREAQARSQEPQVMRSARELYAQGQGDEALKALDQAEKVKGNTKLSLTQIYRLRGQAAILAGKPTEAVQAFQRYLALEPAADGTGLGEEAQESFAAAKQYWANKDPLAVEHLPPGTVAPKKPVVVPVRVTSDPLDMIEKREFRYRREGDDKWITLAMRDEDEEVKLPPNPMPAEGKEYKMQYYITAQDSHQNELDSLGSDKAPLAFLVSKDAIPPKPPIYKRWWFWAGTGAVVAGSIATYAIIQSGELPGPEVGNL